MESNKTSISPNISELILLISNYVKLYIEKGGIILNNCESQKEFKEIEACMNKIQIEDIGITTSTLNYFFQPEKICGIKVLEENLASISVFCMTKNMSLSFHDHPKMTVISKVLYGEIDRISVDIVNTKKSKKNKQNIYTAKIKQKNRVYSDSLIKLNPLFENIHSFRAATNCILFDVLIPNYNNEERNCHFYKEIELKKEKKEDQIYLEEISEPIEIKSFVILRFPQDLTLDFSNN